jgi:IS5 family transposase
VVCVMNTGGILWCCTEDGRRPPRAGLQEQALNHPVLLRSKGVVVSDWEKSSGEDGR